VRCPKCQSTAVKEQPERTAQGYRRFRCLDCTKQFNERSSGLLNRTQYPSDVIALVVLWRLRYKLSLRDLAEMFLICGFVFTYGRVVGVDISEPMLEAARQRVAENGLRNVTPLLGDGSRSPSSRFRSTSRPRAWE
jgi:putative transposase